MTAPALQADAAPAWRRRLAGHLAWNLVAEGLARGASVVLAFACARLLAIEDYGRFALALGIAQVAWLIGDAAANSGFATREVAALRHRAPEQAARLAGALWARRVAAGAALAAAGALAAPLAPELLRMPLVMAAMGLVALGMLPDWAFRAHEDFRALALTNLVAAAVVAAALLLALPRWPHPALAVAVPGAASLAAALVALGMLLTAGRMAPAAGVRPATRRSLVFSLGAVGGIACAQAPMLLAGAALDPHSVGLFGAVMRLVVAWIGLMAVLWWPLFLVLARETPGTPGHTRVVTEMCWVALAASLPAGVACVLWPEPLLVLLFGRPYAAAAPLMAWAAMLLPVHAVLGLLEQVTLTRGREHLRVWAYASGLVATVAVGLLFTARAGGAGALAGLLAGYTTALVIYLAAQHRDLPLAAMGRAARGPLLAAAALAALWALCHALSVPAWPALALGLTAHALLLALDHRRLTEAR